MAIGPFAVELAQELVMGELVGVFLLPLQGLQIELPFKGNLLRGQEGISRHGQQQGKQVRAVGGGALEAQHQGVFVGISAQHSPRPFHQIGEGIGIKMAAAPGHRSGEQLVGAPLTGWIGAAATPDHQPGGQDLGPRTAAGDHRQAAAEMKAGHGVGVRGAHAGTASSTAARRGSRLARASARRLSGSQLSIASSGASKLA